MNWQMIKLDLRKVGLGYFMFLAAFLAYVLFFPKPLMVTDPFAMAGGIGLGVFLAWRIFNDSCSTEAFIFSRPVSRSRFFRQRWLLGLFLQIVMFALIAIVLSTGFRCWIHSGGPYYPMVKWYELNILQPVAILALPTYSIMVFFLLRFRLHRKQTKYTFKRRLALAVPAVILVVLFIPHFLLAGFMPIGWIVIKRDWFILFYGILLIVLTTWASRDCFVKMEVRS